MGTRRRCAATDPCSSCAEMAQEPLYGAVIGGKALHTLHVTCLMSASTASSLLAGLTAIVTEDLILKIYLQPIPYAQPCECSPQCQLAARQ